ncbi:MAG: hypothetical protein IPK69_06615 [Phycisphaerales bacterium]|nr:MAG: hypothetical protein IPK69_06615 [Phycisphaerales bacterium]
MTTSIARATAEASASPAPRRFSLDQLQITAPCPAQWDDMQGTETRRLCADCNLHVHNPTRMSEVELDAFLTEVSAKLHAGERVCARLYRRADGTVLEQNCPRGLAALRQRTWAGVRRVAAVVALAITGVFVGNRAIADAKIQSQGGWMGGWMGARVCRGLLPFSWISTRLGKPVVQPAQVLLGGVICPIDPPGDEQDHEKDLLEIPHAPTQPEHADPEERS